MPSLPPLTLRFLDWLKKTDGRDKLYRLIAYGSKIPIHILKETGGSQVLIERLSKGASAVGLSRKLMRFFRSLQFIQDFLVAFDMNDQLERLLSIVKAFSLSIWMFVDHAQWLAKVGYISLKNEKKLAEIHSKAWFVGLLVGAIQSGRPSPIHIILFFIAYKLHKLYSAHPPKDIKEFRKKEAKTAQGLIKSTTDLIIPSARLGWLNVSDGVVGLAGTITSGKIYSFDTLIMQLLESWILFLRND
jgi:hypothetical protein